MSSLLQFKQKKLRNYTVVDNGFISDCGLSWKAKGILLYLFSRPSNWQVRLNDLVNRSTDGRDSLRSGLKELENSGYLVRNTIRDEKGRFLRVEYEVYEIPLKKYEEQLKENENIDKNVDNPTLSTPKLENPTSDNKTLLNIEYTNKRNIINTLSTKEDLREFFKNISLKEFKDFITKYFNGFKFSDPERFKDDVVFEIRNGFIYCYYYDDFCNREDALYLWNKMYNRRLKNIDVFYSFLENNKLKNS